MSRHRNLREVATRLTTETTDPDTMLVLAIRPDHDDRSVLSSAGNSAIRAAVSVSVAAGNLRAWNDARPGEPTEIEIAGLPEIIRAAVSPTGYHTAQVASVDDGDDRICLAMWLSRAVTVDASQHAARQRALADLAAAVDADRLAVPTVTLVAAVELPVVAAIHVSALESLPGLGEFEQAVEDLMSDETALIVFGIDQLDDRSLDSDAALAVRRECADRIVGGCRRHDLVAIVDDATFAIMLADVDRRQAFDISRRIRNELSAPVSTPRGTIEPTVSVGFAHEVGLIDPTELFESARSAMSDARLEGGSRMLVAC